MKRILIKIGVLGAIFALSLYLFHHFLGSEDPALALQMEEPTFPTVSFQLGSYEVNTLCGYVHTKDIASVRDSITPTDGRHAIDLLVTPYGNSIRAIDYEVLSPDGANVWETGTVRLTKVEGGKFKGNLQFSDAWKENREGVLKLTVSRGGADPLYYYTRVTMRDNLNAENNVNFAKHFHDLTFDEQQEDVVEAYLETTYDSDNGTLHYVNMYNDVDQVMWGDLTIESVGDIDYRITESNATYTSVTLRYSMVAGDEDQKETYDVTEFLRVRPGRLHFYVLSYERTMNLRYETKREYLTKKGLDLGMTDPDTDWTADPEGNFVTYQASDAIWQYNTGSNSLTKIFSFRKEKNSDLRDTNPDHKMKILYQDETGNVSFMVSGYMNSGTYEGQTGVGIYFYSPEDRDVTQKVFLPSELGGQVTVEETPKLAYYSHANEKVYLLIGSNLYQMDTQTGKPEVLIENLTDREYAVSEDGRYLAYPENVDYKGSATIWDMETGNTWHATAPGSQEIRLWGFVDQDLVYGIANAQDTGVDILGETVAPACELKIMDNTGTVQKQYTSEGRYIVKASCRSGLVTVQLAWRDGSLYTSAGKDYISIQNPNHSGVVEFEEYKETTRQRQARILIDQVLREQQPNRVAASLHMSDKEQELELPQMTDCYYVFGNGGVAGIYEEAGNAITAADAIVGVATYIDGEYLWERGNRADTYFIEGVEPIAAAPEPVYVPPVEPEWIDTDGDGIQDSEDPDADGDGIIEDFDNDGIPDVWDEDKDGNGIDDVAEIIPVPDTVAPIVVAEIGTVGACAQMLLNYYGIPVDATASLNAGTGLKQTLRDAVAAWGQGEVMDYSGATPDQLCYLIYHNIPVMAMTDANHAILMIGYDYYGIRFMDPTNGTEGYLTFEDAQSTMSAAGSRFLAISPEKHVAVAVEKEEQSDTEDTGTEELTGENGQS